MKKLLALGIIAGSLLSACGGSSKTEGKIGITVYNASDPFMTLVTTSIQSNIKRLGGTDILSDSNNSQSTQNDQIDSMISSGVSALAINLVDPSGATTVVQKAKSAGVPIILYNKEASKNVMESWDKVWYVGTNSIESGYMQAEIIIEDIKNDVIVDHNGNGKLDYVIYSGEAGHADAIARTDGVIEKLEEFLATSEGQAKFSNGLNAIRDDVWTDWSEGQGNAAMTADLDANVGEIDLVMANNDGLALGAISAIKTSSQEIIELPEDGKGVQLGSDGNKYTLPVYGVDATDPAKSAMRDGWMYGTVLNDADAQGKATAELAYNLSIGKELLEGTDWTLSTDGTKAVRVAYAMVTREDV